MRAREILESALIELNKEETPSLLLTDYNYFINKAIYQFINKTYNLYDLNQLKTDDLRALKTTKLISIDSTHAIEIHGDQIHTILVPDDYLHMLNCIINFKVVNPYGCYKENEILKFGAKRLTVDTYSLIINNYYMKPIYKRPYFMLNNWESENINSKNSIELHCGKPHKSFEPYQVQVDYIKIPTKITLTQELINSVEDTSQELEFPEYVCIEIINELAKLLLENSSDPRMQTNLAINQTIAPPQNVLQ